MSKDKAKPSSRFDIHPVVFWTSAGLILGLVVAAVFTIKYGRIVTIDGQEVPILRHWLQVLHGGISANFGWFFTVGVNVFLVAVVYLMCSRHGRIRLGKDGEKPEFGYLSWLSMLFSAGMGIGLLFYSVAEPIFHFQNPPTGPGETPEAARMAMSVTVFHWGFHAWGIYALVGLALAFFSFRKDLPLTIRSAFHPLLGERIHGPIGNVIDVLAVVATLFGVATSLGLGVQQIEAGLLEVFGSDATPTGNRMMQVLLIAVITGMATTSVVLGLDKGIRRLSEFTMLAAALLLVFVFLAGPTLFLTNSLVQNTGLYLQNILWLSTWTESYTQTDWQDSWTVFYWAWWIAWSPFVGMFIARISRGRTIREFALAVLIVPTALTLVWLTVFGGTALHSELNGQHHISQAVNNDVATALFAMLKALPLTTLSSLLAIVVVIVFFVTSSDSGSLVIDIITAGGKPDPPVIQRIFWAVLEGVVAATLLVAGGLKALQTAAIATGLPFAIVLLIMTYSLIKGLRAESRKARHNRPRRRRPGGNRPNRGPQPAGGR